MATPLRPIATEERSYDVHDLYEQVCHARGLVPDDGLALALRVRHSELRPSGEPHVSLLLHVLTTCNDPLHSFTHLSVKTAWLPPSTVGTIATYLTHQRHFTHISIRDTKLPETGVETILTALTAPSAVNSPLEDLTLTNVGLTARAAVALAPLLRLQLGSLKKINLANNCINGRGVIALTRAVAQRTGDKLEVNMSGNLVTVERANALTHGIGAAVALVAGLALTASASFQRLPSHKVASIATYCVSLFTLLASSCAYHSVFRYPKTHALLRRADHLSIFLLIAGSYTPFVVEYTLDPPTVVGPLVLAMVWCCAVAGMARSVLGVGSNKSRAFFALGTGWVGVLAFGTMLERMPPEAVVLVVSGGLSYSFGMVFYLLGKRTPMLHVVWHLAVMVGGTFHYTALWRFVVNGG